MCKFPIFLPFIISFVYHYVQVLLLFTFHYMFSVPLCASSPSFYIPLYLQCPIMGKFPIYLHFIRSSVSHSGQVPNNFVLHYIFSVPLCASSLSFYLSLFPLCQPLCASSLSFYIPLYLQCPILGKFPIYLHFIISLVSHLGQVPYLFTFHQIFSVPFGASSLSIYISLYLQCPIWGKFPIYLHSIRSSVSHYVQVLHLFTFHYIFSVPLCASSLTSYVSLYIQCPIMGKYPIVLHFIISLVSHFGQVPYLFTFHQIFSVPLCASSPSFYISLYLQCPIWGKFPIYLHFIISSVSHLGQVPYLFTFHYIFSVPFLCASSLLLICFIIFLVSHSVQVPYLYVSLFLQCPILGKYPIILCFIIYLVSHYVQVPYLFTFHYIFSFPFLCASSLLLIHFIIFLVSHSGQVPYSFTFHYIFSVPLCASSLLLLHFIIFLMVSLLASTLSLCLIISFACHYVQVPYLFTVSLYLQCPIMCKFLSFYHYIFSVPLCASTLSFYVSLYLQCPIMCKFPTFVTFHYIFNGLITSKYPIIMFNYIFRISLCASSLSIYISLYLQCPIMCKFHIFLPFIISSVSHYVQVPYTFHLHFILYTLSVPLCASSLSIYISLYLQCPILGKFPIYLHFIISLVSHFGQVPYLFTFHWIFSVPLCACSLSFYLSLYLQFPIMCKFPNFLCFVISSVSHSGQVPYSIYIPLDLQCPIMCKFSIFLHFIISLVSHFVQVP